jgi:hypothetical protein
MPTMPTSVSRTSASRARPPTLVSVATEKGITQYRACPAVNAGTWAR